MKDTANIVFTVRDGVTDSFHADYLDRVRRECCEMVETERNAPWRSVGKQQEHAVVEMHTSNDHGTSAILEVESNSMYVAVRHLLACVKGKQKPLLDVRAGLEDLRIDHLDHEMGLGE